MNRQHDNHLCGDVSGAPGAFDSSWGRWKFHHGKLQRAFFLRHHRWLRRLAQRKFGIASADADDVVQMVFAIAFDVMKTQEVNSEKAWLVAITRRVCANERRRYRTRRDFEAQYSESVYQGGWSVAPPISQIRLALDGLTAAQREVVALVGARGLTLCRAATQLGLPLRVAAHRWESAKVTLRRQLELE